MKSRTYEKASVSGEDISADRNNFVRRSRDKNQLSNGEKNNESERSIILRRSQKPSMNSNSTFFKPFKNIEKSKNEFKEQNLEDPVLSSGSYVYDDKLYIDKSRQV